MDITFALSLAESTSWRKQVVALQGHVVPVATKSGIYHASEDVRNEYGQQAPIASAVQSLID